MTDNDKLQIIISEVCRETGVPIEALRSKSRKREIVVSRQMVYHFAKKDTKYSDTALGQKFTQTHTMPDIGIRAIEGLMLYKGYKERINDLRYKILAAYFQLNGPDFDRWIRSMGTMITNQN